MIDKGSEFGFFESGCDGGCQSMAVAIEDNDSVVILFELLIGQHGCCSGHPFIARAGDASDIGGFAVVEQGSLKGQTRPNGITIGIGGASQQNVLARQQMLEHALWNCRCVHG